MKKENKRMAQERRAKARKAAAARKKAINITVWTLGILACILIIAVIVYSIATSREDSSTETEESASTEVAAEVTDSSNELDTETGVVVEDGDTVNIAFTGYLDGEAFEGGSSESYDLTLGSGDFIDGFEDGVIGHAVGDTFDLDLTFPENYGDEDLAGQAVVFTVTINGVYGK